MMKREEIKGIIFDMDNTLFDFVKAKMLACSIIVDYIGTGEPEELFGYFRRDKHGFEDLDNISDYLRDYEIFTDDRFIECCNIYENEKVRNIELYPGVKETICKLKSIGLPLGVLTDANRKNTRARIRKVGLCRYFDPLVTFDITGEKKPSHTPFYYALDSMGLQPHETLFVGDSLRRDIVPSKQIGMIAAYARYGDSNDAGDIVDTERPDYVLNNFKDIIDIVLKENEHDS
ncbi:HAD family hydrolase [Methanolobus sp. ZRKC3]|uniref:HAD family hydrolase n=1 Tax=Methanolobus sp. ZRKC3 TaxID=3125786 RepID=UPI00324F6318